MKLKANAITRGWMKNLTQMMLFMKFSAIFLLAAFLQVNARGYSQVTINENNTSLQKVLKKIQRQTGYDFLYSTELIQQSGLVSIVVKDETLDKVLKLCLKNKPLTYSIIDRTVIIKPIQESVGIPAFLPETNLNQAISMVLMDVKGKVLNEKREPVEDVLVVVKGSNKSATTNSNGEFTLTNIDGNSTLVFSGINVESFEVKVNGRNNLETISIKTKFKEESIIVVNTGYQTISKERITAAFGSVGNDVISNRPVSNLSNALTGQIAGLVADPLTGFTIRGRSSLSAAEDRIPLVVVDGFPIEGGFSTINPNDVKTVDVLKDAAATSIYGARAANGVIVITTKGTGVKGRINVTYNSFLSIGSKIDLDNYMDMANAESQLNFEEKMYNISKTSATFDPYSQSNNSFRGIRSPYTTLLIERNKGNITNEYFNSKKQEMLNSTYKDDYEKYLLRNSVTQQHNLIISGNSERNSYKFSILYDKDQTSLQFNDINKLLLGFSNIFNISNSIKYTFNTNLTMYNEKQNGISLAHAKSVTSPWTKLIDENGNYTRMNYQAYEPLVKNYEPRLPFSSRYNLLEEASLRDNNYRGQDLRIQNEFEIKIMKGLRFRPMLQYELFNNENFSIYDQNSYAVRNYANLLSTLNPTNNQFTSQIPKGGIYRLNSKNRRESIKMRAQIDYNKNIGSRHEITAVAGAEVISTKTEVTGPDIKFGYNKSGLNYALFDYASDRFDLFGNTVLENSISYEGNLLYDYRANTFRQNYKYNERFIAGYFNGAYTLDGKYTATISARTDASNYVSKTVREKFSPFYSAGLRWNIAREDFLSKATFIDELALRATYGITGNAAGKRSALSLSVFTSQAANTETGNLSNGFITGRDNDFLTWEKTNSTNIGADFSFFKGKIHGSIDFYRRYSKDLLSTVQTSQVIQSTSSLVLNLGEVMNKGLEISIGSKINISKNFSWNGTLNFDYNQNTVMKYNFIAPSLFSYLGPNTNIFIPGLPTDRLMMVKLVGTTKDGYYIQQKKDGELIIADIASRSFADVSSFGLARTYNRLNVGEDNRVYYQGRLTPPATLGFTNTFSYKGFSFMSVITGRFGYKFIRNNESLSYSSFVNNYSASGFASLQSTSLTATTNVGNVNPTLLNQVMLGNTNSLRNFYSESVVEDASFLRLNELYLGYDFNQQKLGKLGNIFKSVTLYTQARNLGTLWTANKLGIDPEYPIGTLKPVKTYTFGMRLGF